MRDSSFGVRSFIVTIVSQKDIFQLRVILDTKPLSEVQTYKL